MVTKSEETHILQKLEALKDYISSLESLAVAFSSGVDSTFLLKVAKEVLGNQLIAVTAKSCFFPEREQKEAETFCKQEGIRQISFESGVLEIEGLYKNPRNRCYLCKKELFKKIGRIAGENGLKNVAEGSNMDDLGDYRPGLLAVEELGVKSPLRKAELYKEEIRFLSQRMKLPTWNKPSFACLASRFVYGEDITREKLSMVDQAEQLLLDMGFRQVRVRIHGKIARIEILPEEFEKLMEEGRRQEIAEKIGQFGFSYVTLDLTGYRMGSMNGTAH